MTDRAKALQYLSQAHRERLFALCEHRFGRKAEAQVIVSIAKQYEAMAAKIIGEAAVVQYIIDHGKVMY